jgi:uncharacterized membrane protein YeiB
MTWICLLFFASAAFCLWHYYKAKRLRYIILAISLMLLTILLPFVLMTYLDISVISNKQASPQSETVTTDKNGQKYYGYYHQIYLIKKRTK